MVCLRMSLSAAVAAAALILAAPGAVRAQTTGPSPAPGAPAQPGQPAEAQPAAPGQPGDPFGEEVTLAAKSMVYAKGTATWDAAFETLVEAFKSVYGYLDKEALAPDGPPMTIYTATDDTGFQYQAGVPIKQEPKSPPQGDLAVGKSPDGKALKFIHRGSYDAMDTTYDAITNFLDEKRLEAKDLFIEQYVTDPRTTAEDKLVVEVYVPVK
jgi:effector-binding domain-containing protein